MSAAAWVSAGRREQKPGPQSRNTLNFFLHPSLPPNGLPRDLHQASRSCFSGLKSEPGAADSVGKEAGRQGRILGLFVTLAQKQGPAPLQQHCAVHEAPPSCPPPPIHALEGAGPSSAFPFLHLPILKHLPPLGHLCSPGKEFLVPSTPPPILPEAECRSAPLHSPPLPSERAQPPLRLQYLCSLFLPFSLICSFIYLETGPHYRALMAWNLLCPGCPPSLSLPPECQD